MERRDNFSCVVSVVLHLFDNFALDASSHDRLSVLNDTCEVINLCDVRTNGSVIMISGAESDTFLLS